MLMAGSDIVAKEQRGRGMAIWRKYAAGENAAEIAAIAVA